MQELSKSSSRLEAAVQARDNDVERLASFTTELCRVLSEPGPLFKLIARHWLEADSELVKALARATVPERFRQALSRQDAPRTVPLGS